LHPAHLAAAARQLPDPLPGPARFPTLTPNCRHDRTSISPPALAVILGISAGRRGTGLQVKSSQFPAPPASGLRRRRQALLGRTGHTSTRPIHVTQTAASTCFACAADAVTLTRTLWCPNLTTLSRATRDKRPQVGLSTLVKHRPRPQEPSDPPTSTVYIQPVDASSAAHVLDCRLPVSELSDRLQPPAAWTRVQVLRQHSSPPRRAQAYVRVYYRWCWCYTTRRRVRARRKTGAGGLSGRFLGRAECPRLCRQRASGIASASRRLGGTATYRSSILPRISLYSSGDRRVSRPSQQRPVSRTQQAANSKAWTAPEA